MSSDGEQHHSLQDDEAAQAAWDSLLQKFEADLRRWAGLVEQQSDATEAEQAVKRDLQRLEKTGAESRFSRRSPQLVVHVCLAVARLSDVLLSLPVDNFEVDARAWKFVTKLLQREHERLLEHLQEGELLQVALHALEDGLATLQMGLGDPSGMGPKQRTAVRSAKFIKACTSRCAMVIRLSKKLHTLRDPTHSATDNEDENTSDMDYRALRTATTIAAMLETAEQCQKSEPEAYHIVIEGVEALAQVLSTTYAAEFSFGMSVAKALQREPCIDGLCILWNKFADAVSNQEVACLNVLAIIMKLASAPPSLSAYTRLRSEQASQYVAVGIVQCIKEGKSQIALKPLLSRIFATNAPQQGDWALEVTCRSASIASSQNLNTVLDTLAISFAECMLAFCAREVKAELLFDLTHKQRKKPSHLMFLGIHYLTWPEPFLNMIIARVRLEVSSPHPSFLGALLVDQKPIASNLTIKDMSCALVLSLLPPVSHPASDRAVSACIQLLQNLAENPTAASDPPEARLLATHARIALIRILRFFTSSDVEAVLVNRHVPSLLSRVLKFAQDETNSVERLNDLIVEYGVLLSLPSVAKFHSTEQALCIPNIAIHLLMCTEYEMGDDLSYRVWYLRVMALTLLASMNRLHYKVILDPQFMEETRCAWDKAFAISQSIAILRVLCFTGFEQFVKALPPECKSALTQFLPSNHRNLFGSQLKRKRALVEAHESPLNSNWLNSADIGRNWSLPKRLEKDKSFPGDLNSTLESISSRLTKALAGIKVDQNTTSNPTNQDLDPSDAYGQFQTFLSQMRQAYTSLKDAKHKLSDPHFQALAQVDLDQFLREIN